MRAVCQERTSERGQAHKTTLYEATCEGRARGLILKKWKQSGGVATSLLDLRQPQAAVPDENRNLKA